MAVEAGVSKATVSRHINGVRVARAAEIDEVIRRLGFQPSRIARSLVSGATHLIGLVVPDVTNPYFSAVVRGIETVARDKGYQVMLCNTDEKFEVEEPVVRQLLDRSVDGLIIAPAKETQEVPQVYREASVPIIFIDRVLGVGNFDSVMVDNVGGSKQAVEYLASAGHQRIAFIGGPLETSPGRERHLGFLKAMDELDIPIRDEYVVISDFRERGGYQAALTLASVQPPPTAALVANNLMSIGALKAFHDIGMALPGDLSMIGFDDFALSELITPPLTVVSRPMEEQGVLAMRLLLDGLRRRPDRVVQHLVLDVHLIIRGSVAPAGDARSAVRK